MSCRLRDNCEENIYFLAIIWMHCSHLVAITLTEKNKHNAIFIDHFNHYITHCVDTSWDCSASFLTFPVIKHSVVSLNHLKMHFTLWKQNKHDTRKETFLYDLERNMVIYSVSFML